MISVFSFEIEYFIPKAFMQSKVAFMSSLREKFSRIEVLFAKAAQIIILCEMLFEGGEEISIFLLISDLFIYQTIQSFQDSLSNGIVILFRGDIQ